MTKKRGLGQEDIIHKSFANHIRSYQAFNKLNCLWWQYNCNGEKRNLITGALLKEKGARKGQADFLFIKLIPCVKFSHPYELTWIEFKTEIGRQSDSQKEFQLLFRSDYFIAKSVEEAIRILEERGIIKK